MSPIYTRPIREQLEHDRVIRELQSRYKRKYEVAINPGSEQNQSVMVGEMAVYPDVVLIGTERGRRVEGTIEVETAESVHLLEARAEWGVLSRLKAPFYLYIPPQAFDTAKRICDEQQFEVTEIWTYHTGLDLQVRFTQAYKSPTPRRGSVPAPKPNAKPVVTPPPPPAVPAPVAPAPTPPAPVVRPAAAKPAKAPAEPAKPPLAKSAKGKSTAPPRRHAKPATAASRTSPSAAKPAKARVAKSPARPSKPVARAKAPVKAGAAAKAKAKKRR